MYKAPYRSLAQGAPLPPIWFIHDLADVLADEVSVWAGDQHVVLRPGEFASAPKGVPHTYRVTSEERARIIVTSSTDEFARFVQAYGEPAPRRELPPAAPPDVERLGRLAAEHGIELLGPPGMLPGDLAAASPA